MRRRRPRSTRTDPLFPYTTRFRSMIHPYIDCTIRLAQQGIRSDDIVSVVCETGEGLVHRLWEPLAAKHQPPSGYAAKFSMPYCMAVGFYAGDAGLAQFSDATAPAPRILALEIGTASRRERVCQYV